jgi:hydrogenase maturation protease
MPDTNHIAETLIVGVGNGYRSDDAVGLYVSRRIEREKIRNVSVINGISDGTSLLDLWDKREQVILIDAVCSGREAGFLHRFDGLAENIPEEYFSAYSTHSFTIPGTIELGKTLNMLPRKMVVFGIEGRNFEAGNKLSPSVKQAAQILIIEIIESLNM